MNILGPMGFLAVAGLLLIGSGTGLFGCTLQGQPKLPQATTATVQGNVFLAPAPDDLVSVIPDAGPKPFTAKPDQRMYDGLENGGCSPLDYAWQAPGCSGSI